MIKLPDKPCMASGISAAMHYKFETSNNYDEKTSALNKEYYRVEDVKKIYEDYEKTVNNLNSLLEFLKEQSLFDEAINYISKGNKK